MHLAKTLEDLGHEVIRIQEKPRREDDPDWLAKAGIFDLFLYTRTWGKMVTIDDLIVLEKAVIPTVSYHLDLYVGLSRKYLHEGKTLDEVLQTDPFWRTDFVFTPDGDPESAEVFKRNGVNHHYMKPGVFKQECYIARIGELDHIAQMPGGAFEVGLKNTEPKIDVLFVGGGDYPGSPNGYGHPEWPYRDKLIQWLRDIYGDRFVKYGHPQQTIRNEDLNQLYANAKVVVGDSVCLGFNHKNYWSDRVYETLGRGGFLIHPYIKGMEEEFKDKEHLVYYEYGNFDQLRALIDYYLSPKCADDRERIRKAGHEFVKNHATYTERLKRMLEIVFTPQVMPTTQSPNAPTLREHLNSVSPSIAEAAEALKSFGSLDASHATAPLKISLGAGTEIEKEDGVDWINTDIVQLPGIDVVHNLMQYPWPFQDESAEHIKAKDIIEHMATHLSDGRSSIIAFIEECYRILKPGGMLWIQTPAWDAEFLWIDPTHVRGFDVRSFDFFDPETDFGRSTGFYSPAKFKVTATMTENHNLQFELVKR